MRRLLILGTAPDNVLKDNLRNLSETFKKTDWKYFLINTKGFKDESIDEYVDYTEKTIDPDYIMDLKQYDLIMVCQPYKNRLKYLNVFLFLKNNGIQKTGVIYRNNVIKGFDLNRISKSVLFLVNRFSFFYDLEMS